MSAAPVSQAPRRVGIVGFGHLGQFLVEQISRRDDLELAFVWNRSLAALLGKVDDRHILDDLRNVAQKNANLIVEVAHPNITAEFGQLFVQCADFMVGSPTAFANPQVEDQLRKSAWGHGVYIPSGALWGGEDIKKMADRGSLQKLRISMKKHPHSFKLNEPLKSMNDKVTECTILYDGSVRGLCSLAPNNVNTMAAASLAAHTLGLDKVEGVLVSDPNLTESHIVEIEAWGAGDIASGQALHVHTVRTNPARVGEVTGSATYNSFLSSMLRAKEKGPGLHLC